MTSKEALDKIAEIYGKTNSLEGTYKYFLAIKKDLSKLDEIRNTFKVEHKGEHYWLIDGKRLYMISKKEFDKWNRWLGNEN